MSEKKSKFGGFFSSGSTTPRHEKDSSSGDEDEYGHLLDFNNEKESKKSSNRSASAAHRSPPSKRRVSNNDAELSALKEAAYYNAKLLATNKSKSKSGTKSSSSNKSLSDSLSSVSRKQFLKSELRVAKEMKEQYTSVLRLESQMASLLDHVDKQETRIENLENQVKVLQQYNLIHGNSVRSGSCFGGNWFS